MTRSRREAIVVGAGQSGLAAAWALQQNGIRPTNLEASSQAGGSWPYFYDGLDHLTGTGALDPDGAPLHRCGVSTTHEGLGYVGLEWQRSLSSASLRGVGRDAHFVVGKLLGRRQTRRQVSA